MKRGDCGPAHRSQKHLSPNELRMGRMVEIVNLCAKYPEERLVDRGAHMTCCGSLRLGDCLSLGTTR